MDTHFALCDQISPRNRKSMWVKGTVSQEKYIILDLWWIHLCSTLRRWLVSRFSVHSNQQYRRLQISFIVVKSERGITWLLSNPHAFFNIRSIWIRLHMQAEHHLSISVYSVNLTPGTEATCGVEENKFCWKKTADSSGRGFTLRMHIEAEFSTPQVFSQRG